MKNNTTFTLELIDDINWILDMDTEDALETERRMRATNEEKHGPEHARLSRVFWITVIANKTRLDAEADWDSTLELTKEPSMLKRIWNFICNLPWYSPGIGPRR